jgi:predicted nucleotidyltransferase
MIPEKIKDRLPKDLIFLGYNGSQAHGTFRPKNDPNSIDDIDVMGVHLASKQHYLGFGRFKGQNREDIYKSFTDEWDIISYEYRKFVELLAKNNPSVLAMLWLEPESVLHSTETWERLVQKRAIFSSKMAYHSFTGYVITQFSKMENFNQEAQEGLRQREEDLRRLNVEFINGEPKLPAGATHSLIELVRQYKEMSSRYFKGFMGNKRKQLVLKHGYDAKNAAHLIRLLRMSVEFLKTGELVVMRPDAAQILEIKQGKWTLDAVKEEAERIFQDAAIAYKESKLPEKPDMEAIESLIVETLEEHISTHLCKGIL